MTGKGLIGVLAVAGACGAIIGWPGTAAPAGGDESGVVVATGRLTDDGGRPQSGLLRAYALPAGGPRTQALRQVASGRADATGRFELRTQDPELLATLSRPKGSANLTVHAFTGSGFGVTIFSSRVANEAGALAASAPGASGQAPFGQGAPGLPSLRIETVRETGKLARAAHPCEDFGDVGAPKYHRRDVYKRPMIIGELNNAYPDTRADFAYGEQADSWVSVGLKVGAEPFKFGGWTHIANSKSSEVGADDKRGPFARRIRSNFYFERALVHVCPYPGAGSVYTEVTALRWSGGLSSRAQSGTLGVCYGGNDYGPGTHFRRNSNRAVQWGPGVEVSWPGGSVDLSAMSGFSRWVRVGYEFGRRVQRHRLCGSGGRDETVAGRIYSGAGRPPT